MSKKKIALLIIVPLAIFFFSLFFGRYTVPPLTVIKILIDQIIPINHTWSGTEETVVLVVRLPRALLAMLIGAGLSISGASFQGMFRNPLVSTDILGVTAGAGFGACLAILVSGNEAIIRICAFAFGVLAVALAYTISRVYKTTPVLMLVLSGMVVSAFFVALISLTKFAADPYTKLPTITFWLMGSLATASTSDIISGGIPIVLGSIVLILVSWRINVLSMGDEEARALGVNTEFLKGIVIVCATIISVSAVCVAGIIGWVGLVVPHIGRMLVGPDHRKLLPACLSIGACYMLIIDDIARTVIASEIPLGILTAIIGAPFFAYLLRRSKGGWT